MGEEGGKKSMQVKILCSDGEKSSGQGKRRERGRVLKVIEEHKERVVRDRREKGRQNSDQRRANRHLFQGDMNMKFLRISGQG